MDYAGDFTPGKTVYLSFNTHTAAGTPITLAGTPAVSVYKRGSTTESTSGVTLTVNYDFRTGYHVVAVDTSADGTFYAAANDFDAVITAGTVDGVSVVGTTVGAFSLSNRSALRPTTADRTLDVTATGAAGIDWGNVENPTTAVNLSATNIDTDQAVASVTGAVGSVTGNVGGNVTGSVGSVATGGITAASIADGAIDRAAFAADTGLQTVRSGTVPSAGSVLSINLDAGASAEDEYYTGCAVYLTGGTGAGQCRAVTAYAGSLKSATVYPAWVTEPDNTTTYAVLPGPAAAVEAGNALSNVQAMAGGVITATVIANNAIGSSEIASGAITAAKFAAGAIDAAALAADAVAEIQSGLATAAGVSAVETDTQDIQARLPAALVSGRMDASVGAMAAGTLTAAATADSFYSEMAFRDIAAVGPPGDGSVLKTLEEQNVAAVSGGVTGDVAGRVLGLSATAFQGVGVLANDSSGNAIAPAATALSTATWTGTLATNLATTNTTVATNLDAAVSTRATPAQVNAEVLDVVNVDTFAEPSGPPAATATLSEKIGRLHQVLRNKITVTAASKTFYSDAGAALWSKALTDDGTTYQEAEGA